MSVKKFPIPKLCNIAWHLERDSNRPWEIPIDWDEYNKLYYSTRPVVVHVPCSILGRCNGVVNLLSIYCAQRMAYADAQIGLYSPFIGMSTSVYDRIKKSKLDGHREFCKRIHNSLSESYTDWVVNISIEDALVNEGVSKLWKSLKSESMKSNSSRKKVLALVDMRLPGVYERLKVDFPDLVYMDYTPEKRFVDDWFASNPINGILDPLFDIKLSEGSLNKRRLLAQVATNHPNEFREYAKYNHDFLIGVFGEERLADWLSNREFRSDFGELN